MIVRYAWMAVVVAIACKAGQSDGRTAAQDTSSRPTSLSSPTPPSSPTSLTSPSDLRPAIVFLGTSLTAGDGLRDPAREAYPAIIQAKLDSAGRAFRVVNAGISGESSAGALTRIEWLLGHDSIAVLVVETGANDGLRGQDPDSVRARIQAIFDRARHSSQPPRLVVVGMEALPNLGQDYVRRFRAIYPAVARANHASLVPFLLAGVAGVDSLNQDDGIHPTAAGHRILAENVWRVLEIVTRSR
jgi:acyl-CoA thioesterase-1